MHRVQVLSGHLSTNNRVGMRQSSASAAAPNDIAVVHGLRTAISRAKRGSFKLLSAVMSAVLKDVGLRPSLLGDVCVVPQLTSCETKTCVCDKQIRQWVQQWFKVKMQ
uniref:Uncharacterized protein n=2 Tax=Cyprinus carpio TaxID=7962 RepID=A0A8C1EJS1_CYPCA